jgi:P-type conjugative transfer protein TrbJ
VKQRFCLLITAVGLALALPLAVLPESEAAIPVIDSANISQQNMTYLETVKTVLNTAQQITLQLQELKSLSTGTLSSYQSILNREVNAIQASLAQATGILNPQKPLDTIWTSTFKPAGTVTAGNFTTSTAGAVNTTTIAALDAANYDSFQVVKTALASLDQTKANLDNLMTLNAGAEGQKQSAQINNMLLAEQAKLLQQQNIIRAAEATARIAYYERRNQLDALAEAQGRQAAEATRNMDTNVR